MIAHLVPVGRGRFELYAEAPDVDEAPGPEAGGRVRRWVHAAGAQWQGLVDTARRGESVSRLGRWRDAVICRLAESIDEQRTLRTLRKTTDAVLRYPSTLDLPGATAALRRILVASQRRHGRRFAAYLVLFIASGVLFFVPGPNVVAYYLGFQAFGHLQAWRGARQAQRDIAWTYAPTDLLAELGALLHLPHPERAARVEAIASALDLAHLPAFFERASG